MRKRTKFLITTAGIGAAAGVGAAIGQGIKSAAKPLRASHSDSEDAQAYYGVRDSYPDSLIARPSRA
jgi:hypothetical protein